MNRRTFLRNTTLTGVLAGVVAQPTSLIAGENLALVRQRETKSFPKDFWWGVATAAYQIEGGVNADGRGPSIWDTFCRRPGAIKNNDTGDVACDHFHRYAQDVKLMAELGVKHYRFSISWSRVIPDGSGAVNEKGLDFYRRLVDELLQHDITPHATLYHWDLPQALQDRYAGWQSREVVNDFAHYATVVASSLGDRITHWITMNEIAAFCVWCGYHVGRPGEHAPGISLATQKDQWQLTHHALLAHGSACQAIRAASPEKCHLAVADNFTAYVPAIESPEHIAAAKRAFVSRTPNANILLPLLTGRYNETWLAEQKDQAPDIADGDMKLIAQRLDALGFNCYSGAYIRAANTKSGYEVIPRFEGFPKANMSWLDIVPESMYWGVRLVGEATGKPRLPIFISENGCPDGAGPDAQGDVFDTDRIMFLRGYLANLQRAQDEGYPVIGYFPWSLLDNFEWADGYSKRFGLVRTDYTTQQRIPKLSYHWYQQVIEESRLA
jgi:beta-glucosidase